MTNQRVPRVLNYNKNKGVRRGRHGSNASHIYNKKRNPKHWSMVYFYNMVDLPSIASRVIFKGEFPESENALRHEDERQRFNITIGCSLVVAQLQ
ncbi:hypothetical protein PoB_001558800 [Plakobranchus ocellatus]|uniref:Uncharacterized protein n=1 Tax=Plakobranchus ocellatus TaxID=259542 RepID=A0AAV3Z3B0_9GAST|nr:hypothetical protein PoB_001558800 [Plakobranchus ocellatus]